MQLLLSPWFAWQGQRDVLNNVPIPQRLAWLLLVITLPLDFEGIDDIFHPTLDNDGREVYDRDQEEWASQWQLIS